MLQRSPLWDLGRAKFDWWPDWRGQTCAIVASGPSAKREQLDQLRGRLKIIAIKQSVDLVPFADAVYGCDDWWWKHRRGLPEFKGLKLAWGDRACAEFANVHKIEIKDKHLDRLALEDAGSVGAGGNSGFQALNLALQFGASRVMLIGFDMHARGGLHWYGRNNWTKANNPDESNFMRWRGAFAKAAAQLAGTGIEVINASVLSDLKCFPRRSTEQALKDWAL